MPCDDSSVGEGDAFARFNVEVRVAAVTCCREAMHEPLDIAARHLALADRRVPRLVEGLYLQGSVALGDCRPGVSDIDFVAVTRESFPRRRCVRWIAWAGGAWWRRQDGRGRARVVASGQIMRNLCGEPCRRVRSPPGGEEGRRSPRVAPRAR
jgi:hypothetical protein